METSTPDPQRNEGPAGAYGDTSDDPALRGSSAAPDLDDEQRPVRSKPVDDPKAKPGGETPGREPYDPQGGS